MFQTNDVITYGVQGICKIVGTEEKSVNGKKRIYYVLKPVSDKASTIFVPTDNELALGKMRRLLTKEEIYRLMDSLAEENGVWIENENQRREHYKSILARGDRLELMRMIKAIDAHKKEREAEGKRLHISDERFFKDAEQILYNEFRYVLEIDDKDSLMRRIFPQSQT